MKRLTYLIFLSLVCAVCYGVTDRLDSSESYVRFTKTNDSDFRIEINIADYQYSNGKVELPTQFKPYLRNDKSLPLLSIQVALPETGEYICQQTLHMSQPDIVLLENKQHGSETVTLSKPYWLRDIRGMEVIVSPFTINDGKLVVAEHITLDLICQNKGNQSSTSTPRKLNPYFIDLYKQHFINFEYRYEEMAEYGSMAVICPTQSYDIQIQQFKDLIQPWVDWKNQKGIPTTVYSTNDAGDTYEEIQAFIQDLYDNDPNLTFVQLVGDYAQVPCLVTTMSGNTGGMDAFYTLLKGDDGYPDIFVGRFSAETAAELYTQIKRSIEYEKNPLEGEWLNRAAGVCSDNPPIPGDDGEHNWEHLDNIRTDLLEYGYTYVDRVYANEGASLQDLIDCLNEGKSLVNYCGEGYPTHWVNPPFSVTDAENLTNTGMLPFIHVVSCWTGQFYDGTCLSEALMRSRDTTSEEARGAIAVYSAAPEQGVDVPMESQDHAMELLVSGTKNTIGGLCFNGSSSMIDEYGELGGVYNFLAWNLFGDASLVLRTKPAEVIEAILPDEIPQNLNNVDIDTGSPDILVALSKNNEFVASCFSDADGIAQLQMPHYPAVGDRYVLALSGFNRKPILHNLECYNPGMHENLDLVLMESDQFIEPETEIFKTIRVTNRGQITSGDVSISLQNDSSNNLEPVIAFQNIGQILPGETKETTLSFRINKGTQDLSTVHYSILVYYYRYYHFSDVVHAPTIIIESVNRAPQINWINPGDTFSLRYKIKNEGSAVLRELHGWLEASNNYLQISGQNDDYLTLSPGAADTLTFEATVSPICQGSEQTYTYLDLEALNSIGTSCNQWLVIAPGKTMESFESHDLQTFPWLYQGDQWTLSDTSYDGVYGLISQPVSADSISLEISFISLQAGKLSFHYLLNDGNDRWKFIINQDEIHELDTEYEYKLIDLNEGFNTIRWVGKRDPASEVFDRRLWLDAIQFPSKTVFANARLDAEANQLEITLAPGEVSEVPIALTSLDGKFIHYDAVVQKSNGKKDNTDSIRLTSNKASFTPGTSEVFLFTLYNSSPNQAIKQISIGLPEKVLGSTASPFSMPEQTSLPFSGSLGSFSELVWENQSGSLADSLRSGVRLVFDAGYSRIVIPYSVISANTQGESIHTNGEIELLSAESTHECLTVTTFEGELNDEDSSSLVLRANQNALGTETENYNLYIYYNGLQMLSVPVTVRYDANPPGFYDDLHLTNYPNPMKETTTFSYAVPEDGSTKLIIYNIRGQKVRTLVNGEVSKGFYRTPWLLVNDNGKRVASGIYFCRLIAPSGKEKTIKCIVVK